MRESQEADVAKKSIQNSRGISELGKKFFSKFPIIIILFARGAMRPLRDEREGEKDGTWKGQIKLFLHFPHPSFLIPQLSLCRGW